MCIGREWGMCSVTVYTIGTKLTLQSLVVNICPTCMTIWKSAFFMFRTALRVNRDLFL
jgi:hypothetical protein